MPSFQYTAMDAHGKEQKGRIDAESESAASDKLKDQGLFPTSISVASGGKGGGKSGGQGKKKSAKKYGGGMASMTIGTPKLRRKTLSTFTRQLATLLEAGLPLVRALRTLERQTKNVPEKRVIAETADGVEGGKTFSDALALNPKSFNKLYINMVKAGEASGDLEQVLARLAEYMEKAARLRAKVKSALIYPVVVLFIALTITTLLLIFIVPKFKKMFEDMLGGDELPWLTNFVITISTIVKDHALWAFLVLILFVVAFILFKRTKVGSYILDYVSIKLPPFGGLVTKSTVARFCSTLGTLMQSGVSVLNALVIVRDTSGNEVVARAVQVVHDAVKEGEAMAKPLEESKVFPLMVISMIEVGEETGALPEMLGRVATVYEEEVDMAVEGLTSLIEPVMIVFLGVLVGGIVLAMFMPLIKLIDTMSNM